MAEGKILSPRDRLVEVHRRSELISVLGWERGLGLFCAAPSKFRTQIWSSIPRCSCPPFLMLSRHWA